MKLTQEQKLEMTDKIWSITVQCYRGVELPTREKIERIVRQGDVFVEEWYREVVSYVIVSPDYNPPLIRSVATLPSARGQGLATRLMWEVERYYRSVNAPALVLHVRPENPAQKMYFDCGYRVTKYLKGYYAPEGDGLEMELKLL
ncbi:MAG: hypothetical protein C5B59_08820 [Bacteroidetes bacterium]|nr:MAG: hypothetical protein C5B59_08820 [Bacteroidota bacterium]